MSITVYNWRLYCNVEEQMFTTWRDEDEGLPTQCPHCLTTDIRDVVKIDTVSTDDVQIAGVTEGVEVPSALKGFHDLTGHNIVRFGDLMYDIEAGVHNIFYEKFATGMYLEGGGVRLPKYMYVNGEQVIYKPEKGDYITFDMVDIDGVLNALHQSAKNADILKVSRTDGVTTITTTENHSFLAGEVVCIDCDDETFSDMEEAIASVPTSNTLTYANPGSDVAEKDASGDVGLIVLLGQFVPQDYMSPGEEWDCIKGDAKYIPGGIYLRFRYVSIGATDLVVMPFYSLRT